MAFVQNKAKKFRIRFKIILLCYLNGKSKCRRHAYFSYFELRLTVKYYFLHKFLISFRSYAPQTRSENNGQSNILVCFIIIASENVLILHFTFKCICVQIYIKNFIELFGVIYKYYNPIGRKYSWNIPNHVWNIEAIFRKYF